VKGVAFSPDGRLLAGACGDGTVWQWNPAAGQSALLTVPSVASVGAVAFSPDGTLLASAYSDGTIRLWNSATGRLARSPLQMDVGGQENENGVAFSPDENLLASAYGSGTLRLWNLDTGQHGGLASRGWLVTTASVIAIVLAAFASVITMREIRLAGRRLPSAGRQLWRSCC
jgi:WD40 repeat protein